jgi:hypothetical protein
MMVLKHFNLPFNPPPTRGSEKRKDRGGGGRVGEVGWGKKTCLKRFFGATPICVVWKSAVQFTN